MSEALATAQAASMDLVQVMGDGDPPVCKLMDYGKYKYKQKKRQHGGKHKHQPQLKEIRLRPNTGEHDVEIKLKHAREFLEKKDKVSVSMRFRGREMAHTDLGRDLMMHFAEQLQDMAKVESHPRQEGRRMTMLLAPK